MFIVIEFIQNYDDVYGEKNLGLFESEAIASKFVSERANNQSESNK